MSQWIFATRLVACFICILTPRRLRWTHFSFSPVEPVGNSTTCTSHRQVNQVPGSRRFHLTVDSLTLFTLSSLSVSSNLLLLSTMAEAKSPLPVSIAFSVANTASVVLGLRKITQLVSLCLISYGIATGE